MPPRKLIKNTKGDESFRSSSKLVSSRTKGKNDSKDGLDNNEPEIDVMAAIEEMLRESNERIAAVLQQRQENLVQTISNVEVPAGSTPKGTKK